VLPKCVFQSVVRKRIRIALSAVVFLGAEYCYKFFVNNQLYGRFELLDQMGEQWIDLPEIKIYQKIEGVDHFRVVIHSVYPGNKYPDVCITEIFTRGG